MTTVPVWKSPGTIVAIVELIPLGVFVIESVPVENTFDALAEVAVKLAPDAKTALVAMTSPARASIIWNRLCPSMNRTCFICLILRDSAPRTRPAAFG